MRRDPDHTKTIQIPRQTLAELATEWHAQLATSERPTVNLHPGRRSSTPTEPLPIIEMTVESAQ